MDGWHWVAASVMAVLLIILILLRYDTYRERKGVTLAQATKRAALLTPIIPIAFVIVLLVPLWLGWILVAAPAAAILVGGCAAGPSAPMALTNSRRCSPP